MNYEQLLKLSPVILTCICVILIVISAFSITIFVFKYIQAKCKQQPLASLDGKYLTEVGHEDGVLANIVNLLNDRHIKDTTDIFTVKRQIIYDLFNYFRACSYGYVEEPILFDQKCDLVTFNKNGVYSLFIINDAGMFEKSKTLKKYITNDNANIIESFAPFVEFNTFTFTSYKDNQTHEDYYSNISNILAYKNEVDLYLNKFGYDSSYNCMIVVNVNNTTDLSALSDIPNLYIVNEPGEIVSLMESFNKNASKLIERENIEHIMPLFLRNCIVPLYDDTTKPFSYINPKRFNITPKVEMLRTDNIRREAANELKVKRGQHINDQELTFYCNSHPAHQDYIRQDPLIKNEDLYREDSYAVINKEIHPKYDYLILDKEIIINGDYTKLANN